MDSNELKEKRKSVIDILNQFFALQKIDDLNQYYYSFYTERESSNFINAIDGIGIKTQTIPALTSSVIESPINNSILSTYLEKLTSHEKLRFYREAAYLYIRYENSFLTTLEIISNQMRSDGLEREARIIEFEIRQTRYYDEYLTARKEKQNK